MKEKAHGGKRVGAGRPDEGKQRYTVTLTADSVTRARVKRSNFSKLLDDLLSEWLKKNP
jgi:hypothetical protein